MVSSFNISASGMEAQRHRLNTIASNLANVSTTRGLNGEPYRRRDVIFGAVPASSNTSSSSWGGSDGMLSVKVLGVIEDGRPFKSIYEPGHPDAGEDGYLRLPNVNPVEEMINMMSAIRSYEANVTAFNSEKDMMMKTLDIAR
jgi:flagellar basal-body rod protein FlgC